VSILPELIARLADGNSLNEQQARDAFDYIMEGNASEAQIAALLMGMRVRGETVDEITGAVSAMRARMIPVQAPDGAVDIVGTGGDGKSTYNVSTATAFVVAGCGVPVAKHGNRAVSSKSGAADVLMALGVNLECSHETVAQAIREAGIGFMFAPQHHSAMKHVAPVRKALGIRTIFNLLGPLSNPAGVKRQLLGVFDERWVEPLARALAQLGCEAAWVVHSEDGMDEITVTAPTHVCELKNAQIRTFTVTPEECGLEWAEADALVGGDADTNASALKSVLQGEAGPYRDTVLMNAGATLLIAGKASSLLEGVEIARDAIDSGKAQKALDTLVSITNV
jgi:anthranilate phosphoribosyltransferase